MKVHVLLGFCYLANYEDNIIIKMMKKMG